jgi:hypothetical protein
MRADRNHANALVAFRGDESDARSFTIKRKTSAQACAKLGLPAIINFQQGPAMLRHT